MTRTARVITVMGLLVSFSVGLLGAESITPQKAEADAEQLGKDLETLQNAIQSIGRGGNKAATSKSADAGAQAQAEMDKLSKFENDVVAPIQAHYDAYTKNYGNSRNAIDKKFEQILGKKLRRRPSWAWEELTKELKKANDIRGNAAHVLVLNAKRILDHMANLNKNIWAKSFDEAKSNLEIALKFDPSNEDAKALLATVDQKKSEALTKLNAEIDKAEWRPHSPRFNGPGDPDELARIAFEQLRMDDNGNVSDGVLAVRINGDWRVWDEVLGIPKTYGLPIEVAYAVTDEPNNASVLSMTMVTRGNKMAPPFRGNPGIGDSYKIRINKVPGMSGGAAPFFLFRLGLSFLLILSGIVAAAPLLQPLNPNVGSLIDKITPFKAIVGVVTLGTGLLFFVKNLLWLSPFADLLPQLAAVMIGLLLGLELLLKAKIPSSATAAKESPTDEADSKNEDAAKDDSTTKDEGAPKTPDAAEVVAIASEKISGAAEKGKEAGEAAAQKLQDMLAANQDKIKSLRKYQVKLGVLCIALGFFHLLIAGWWLF